MTEADFAQILGINRAQVAQAMVHIGALRGLWNCWAAGYSGKHSKEFATCYSIRQVRDSLPLPIETVREFSLVLGPRGVLTSPYREIKEHSGCFLGPHAMHICRNYGLKNEQKTSS